MPDCREYILEVKKNGSETAFFHLVQMFEHRVFTMCYRILHNREEAEEAAQDVFLKCYRNIQKLEDPDKFPQWLLKIAYSKAIDYARKKKVIKLGLEEINEISADLNSKLNEEGFGGSESLEKALKMLDTDNIAIINLYYQENFSIHEIAELMDLSDSNVKIRLHRSRNEIRRILESEDVKAQKLK